MGKLGKNFEDIMSKIEKQVSGDWKASYDGRPEERIDIVLALIREVWKRNPSLRLCQLIGNCFDAGDNYNREDHELLCNILRVYLGEEDE